MRFLIMNGAGNRFAIFDAREDAGFALRADKVAAICAPGSPTVKNTVMGPKGADQLIILRAAKDNSADVFMEIWNQKGFEVDACGNATRCAAWLVMQESGQGSCTVQTNAGLLLCMRAGEMSVTVDMGEPKLDWTQIPLEENMHTHHIDVKLGPIDNPVLSNPGAVNMGNPHCVFFVDDFEVAKPELAGPMIEFHPLFPKQANVGFARIDSEHHMRLKVWERGVGMTLACGTGACAAVVAAVRQSRGSRRMSVELDGGTLQIEWRLVDDHVIMTGPVELEMDGTI